MTQHLTLLDPTRRTYGTLSYEPHRKEFVISGDRIAVQMAKRLFPGVMGDSGIARFSANARNAENLNWFMLRWPLEVLCVKEFHGQYEQAVAMAERRSHWMDLPPTTPPPTFKGTLLPYQMDDVSIALASEHLLIAHQMGLGKTVIALAILASCGLGPALVIVEPQLVNQWCDMIEEFLSLPHAGQLPIGEPTAEDMVYVCEGRTPPSQVPDRPIYIIHYGILPSWKDRLLDMQVPVVVMDEVQNVRRVESQKHRACLALCSEAQIALGLSGTPVYNYGAEIWSVMNVIQEHCLGSHSSFTQEWCGHQRGEVVQDPVLLGSYLRDEGLMIRRRKRDAEVASVLPPKRRKVIDIDHDKDVYLEQVQHVIKLAHAWNEMRSHDRYLAGGEIDRVTRLASGVAKAPFAAAWIRSLLQAGERVVVFAHHHAVHEILAQELEPWGVSELTGRITSRKERHRLKQAFIDGENRVALIALRAAAGIDGLQKAGTCVVIAELDWSPAIHEQCEDRMHRQGLHGMESLLVYYLVSSTSYDLTVENVLGLKTAQARSLMGDTEDETDDMGLNEAAARQHIQRMVEALAGTPSPS